MKCLVCKEREAERHPVLGYLSCKECRLATTAPKPVEFTSDSIKEQRKEHAKDLLQPYRKGVLSKEYVEAHGTRYIKASKEEIKKAKNVWSEDRWYN